MIHIAIVDDSPYSIDSCRKIITAANFNDLDIVDAYSDGKSFLNSVINKKEYYDIIILDIDMPDLSGFDVARKLREKYPEIIIMFYTVHEQYVFQSFEFQPFRYIRKELAEKELPFALNCAIERIHEKDIKNILIKTADAEIRIEIQSIVCLEKNQKHTDIFTSDGTQYTVRNTLLELMQQIDSSDFIYAHKGAIVNLRHVKQISPTDLIMKSNKSIPISRRYYKDLKAGFARYLGGAI